MYRSANTIVVIMGVSECPDAVGLDPIPQCRNSALDFNSYLQDELGLVADDDVLDLFDSPQPPPGQITRLRKWISARIEGRKGGSQEIENIIIYYGGHGGFAGDQSFFLATRTTATDAEGATSIRFSDLSTAVKMAARGLRRYFILDCCYAGASVIRMAQLPKIVEKQIGDALPGPGTAVYCASSAKLYAIAPPGERHTMFSGALLKFLRQGLVGHPEFLSFDDLEVPVANYIIQTYLKDAVRPELHAPDQSAGDPKTVRIFPNKEWKKQGICDLTPVVTVPKQVVDLKPVLTDPRPIVQDPEPERDETIVPQGRPRYLPLRVRPLVFRDVFLGAVGGILSAFVSQEYVTDFSSPEKLPTGETIFGAGLAVPLILGAILSIVARSYQPRRPSYYFGVFGATTAAWLVASRIATFGFQSDFIRPEVLSRVPLLCAGVAGVTLIYLALHFLQEPRWQRSSRLLSTAIVPLVLITVGSLGLASVIFFDQSETLVFQLAIFVPCQGALVGGFALVDSSNPQETSRSVALWLLSSIFCTFLCYLILSDTKVQKVISQWVGDVPGLNFVINRVERVGVPETLVLSFRVSTTGLQGLTCNIVARVNDFPLSRYSPGPGQIKVSPDTETTGRAVFLVSPLLSPTLVNSFVSSQLHCNPSTNSGWISHAIP
ncbi:hypothetical protein [Rhizobium laguerreae]|uniref:hypothetical protein n=1 Tax=Rhizobium laguerreae TaxID=1076926 RepID=UPI00197F61C1|nr:hypothetical protein [Rhizobium laguerreae]NKM36365.1 hypothetical protein [Rhizobium laguerreae]